MPDAAVLIVGAIAVLFGGVVHATIGFGFAMVAVPIIALVEPMAVPATLLLLSIPVNLFMLTGEREVDRGGAIRLSVGKALGTVIAAWLLVQVPTDRIGVVFGASLLAAAIAAGVLPSVKVTATREVVVGTLAGVMGATTAVGGPLLGVLYSSRDGRVLRSTLAVVFLAGLAMALAAQVLIGRLMGWHLLYAVLLLPALALGLAAGRKLQPLVDTGFLRRTVLVVAGAAGLYTIVSFI